MSPKPITQNTLFYGDNLIILREHIPNESVNHFSQKLFIEIGSHFSLYGAICSSKTFPFSLCNGTVQIDNCLLTE